MTETSARSKWETRPLTAEDQEFLWEMLYVALWDAPDEKRRPRTVLDNSVIRRLVEDWGRPDDFGLVAVDPANGRRVGAIWSRLDRYDQLDDFGCPYPCLGIGVEEAFQGTGVGSCLMQAFIAALKDRIEGLRLGVHPMNHVAQSLYRKYEFVEYAVGHGGYPQMRLPFR